MFKRTAVALLAGLGLVLVTAIPAQAAVPEQARFTVVEQVQITNELGQVNYLPVLQAANGVADLQMRSFSACPGGHSCGYVDINGGGAMLDIVWSVIHGHCNNLNGGWDNVISSFRIGFGSNYGLNVWSSQNCGSVLFAAHLLHNTDYNMTGSFGAWNDTISSLWDCTCR